MISRLLTATAIFVALASPSDAALAISRAPSSNITCVSGTCTATAADASLNIKDVKQLLKAGDLKIVSGSAAQDIAFNIKLNWTSAHRLTLNAFRSITFSEAVTAEGTGAVTLITDDGGSGGDYLFVNKGKLAFWDTSSSLIINGTSFTLVNDIHTLAAGVAANPSGAFALAKGYDASVDGAYTSLPVMTPFGGEFEGLGHAVQNLSLRLESSVAGFFREILVGGVVRDLGFTNALFFASGQQSGVAGLLTPTNYGFIGHVTAEVSVNAQGPSYIVGGLVGTNNGIIDSCAVSGAVTASTKVIDVNSVSGGLVGFNGDTVASATVTRSRSSAQVQANTAGGLIGANRGKVSLSYATGNVSMHYVRLSHPPAAGGLVGADNQGSIDQSFATGSVIGKFEVGGLVGNIFGTVISNAYAEGTVSVQAHAHAGGFVGEASYGNIASSYTIGAVSGSHPHALAGFISVADDSNESDYWDIDTAGTSRGCDRGNCSSITGLTDAQLKSGLPAGFDPAIWGQNAAINNGYPYLIANPPPT